MKTKTLYEDYEFTIKNHYYSATAYIDLDDKMLNIHCYDQYECMDCKGNPDIAVDEYNWNVDALEWWENIPKLGELITNLKLSKEDDDIEREVYITCLIKINGGFYESGL